MTYDEAETIVVKKFIEDFAAAPNGSGLYDLDEQLNIGTAIWPWPSDDLGIQFSVSENPQAGGQDTMGGEGDRDYIRYGDVMAEVRFPDRKRGESHVLNAVIDLLRAAFEGTNLDGVRFPEVMRVTGGQEGKWITRICETRFWFVERK